MRESILMTLPIAAPVDLSPITPSWGEWGSVSEYDSLGGPHTPDEAALLAAGTGVGTGAGESEGGPSLRFNGAGPTCCFSL